MPKHMVKNLVWVAAGVTLGILATLASARYLGNPTPEGNWAPGNGEGLSEQLQLPPDVLHAMGASANDAFAITTGPIEDGEGLFLLDFLTGELKCHVIYPRFANNPNTGGVFKANVTQPLGVEAGKKPRYLMATGQMDFPRGAGGRLANSVCYVVDANTGNYAAYAVPWIPNAAASGTPQANALVLLGRWTARNIPIGE